MTTQNADTLTPEMTVLKGRLKASWESGDYAHFATLMERGALEFLARLELKPGQTLLDIGCGAGQLAIPAAHAGVRVTGIDLARPQIDAARKRAVTDVLEVHFDEGDAEMLPYADDHFDVVVSLFGAMFAPRPERVAAEMVRVCKPGGRLVMANWTAEGFVGQLLKTVVKYAPLSPLMPSPLLWGDEAVVRERFGRAVAELSARKQLYPFDYPFNPKNTATFYRMYYGPVNRAFAALDPEQQHALFAELTQLWTHHNRARDTSTCYDSDYLEVTALKSRAR